MKLSHQQEKDIFAINCGAVRQLNNGDYYYTVPTTVRRTGKMLIKKETVDKFKQLGLITIDI